MGIWRPGINDVNAEYFKAMASAGTRYFSAHSFLGGQLASVSIPANTLLCCPFEVGINTPILFDRLAFTTATAASGATARIGIYSNRNNGFFPKTKIVDAGVVSIASTGGHIAVINKAISGIIWMAIVHNYSSTVNVSGLDGYYTIGKLGVEDGSITSVGDNYATAGFNLGAAGSEADLPDDYENDTSSPFLDNGPCVNLFLRVK